MSNFSIKVISPVVVAAIATTTAFFFNAETVSAADFHIKANISGLADGSHILLKPLSHEPGQPVLASATSQDGSFSLDASFPETICALISIEGSYGSIPLMLDSDNISINAKADSTDTGNGFFYSFHDLMIQGSPLSLELRQHLAVKDSLNAIRDSFSKRYKDVIDSYSKAYSEKDSAGMASIKQSEKYLNMREENDKFFNLVSQSYDSLFDKTKNSALGPVLILYLTTYLSPDMRDNYTQLSEEAKQSFHGKQIFAELWPAGSVGQKAHDFTVNDNNGNNISLQQLLDGHKYLLIDFWASWCGPCRREIPNLKSLYDSYAKKGFQIVSISIDKNKEAWEKALEEEQLSWPNFLSNEVADLYKVKAVPTMYLLDSEGNITAEGENARGEKLKNLLQNLFEN